MIHHINGRMFCNLRVDTKPNTKLRVLLASFGSEEGIHSPRIIGQVLLSLLCTCG
jgi:hypothetical protein